MPYTILLSVATRLKLHLARVKWVAFVAAIACRLAAGIYYFSLTGGRNIIIILGAGKVVIEEQD